MAEPPNFMLREHVTRVGFNLSLARTQIMALVWIETETREKRRMRDPRPLGAHFISGVNGLKLRGLVIHVPPPSKQYREEWETWHLGKSYKLTKAGRLVRDLLKESGLWQEYEEKLVPAQPQTKELT